MFAIIGIIMVFGMVIGWHVLEHGNLNLLHQPVELMVIGGAVTAAFLISSAPKIVLLTLKSIGSVFEGRAPSKAMYLESLTQFYQIFSKIRKEGMVSKSRRTSRHPARAPCSASTRPCSTTTTSLISSSTT